MSQVDPLNFHTEIHRFLCYLWETQQTVTEPKDGTRCLFWTHMIRQQTPPHLSLTHIQCFLLADVLCTAVEQHAWPEWKEEGSFLSLDWVRPTLQLLFDLTTGYLENAEQSEEDVLGDVIQGALDHIWSIIQVPGCAKYAPLLLARSVFMPRKCASGALDICKYDSSVLEEMTSKENMLSRICVGGE